MKKVMIISLVFLLAAMGYVNAYTIEERQFASDGSRTEWNSGVSETDTYQKMHPDWLIVEVDGYDYNVEDWVLDTDPYTSGTGTDVLPAWGPASHFRDAGVSNPGEWWDMGGVTKVFEGTYYAGRIGVTLKPDVYKEENSAWVPFDGHTLDSLTIIFGESNPSQTGVNYDYSVEWRDSGWNWHYLDLDLATPGDQTRVTGGSDTVGVGTKVVISDLNLADCIGFRVTSNGTAQPGGGWDNPIIAEIDAQWVPEPATMALLGLGGLLLRKRR